MQAIFAACLFDEFYRPPLKLAFFFYHQRTMRMIFKRLLILLAIVTSGLTAAANHVLGGNITWECLGGDQYEITFTMYKDCYGTPGDPATEILYFFPSGCGAVPFSVDLDFVSAVEISDLCVTEFVNSSCSGGLAPGTMQVTYSGVVTLDAGCLWEAIWNNGSWNYFQNIEPFDLMGNPYSAFIYSEINTSAPCDNSIDIPSSLADPAIEYACFGSPFCHQIDVANPGGYTLTYALGTCLTTGATIDNPVNVLPGAEIPVGVTVSATGNLCWPNVNNAFGNYIFCVEITMMDGPTYIGTLYENVVIVVRNCTPTNTDFVPDGVSSVGAETTQINATTVEVCAGDTLQFSVTAENADLFRAITLDPTSYAPSNPGFTFVQSGLNPAIGTFTLVTTGAMTTNSPYTITITATDDACPNPDTDVLIITAHVRPNVELDILSDTVCADAPVTLTASGLPAAGNYSWSAVGDPSPLTPTGVSQSVTPNITTTYTVTAIGVVVPAQCSASASATIYVSLSSLTLNPTAETCSNDNGAIDLTVNGDGSGNYTYVWTPYPGSPDPQDISGLNNGPYNVTVTDVVYGCVAMGAANVGDVPAPTLAFTGGVTICAGGIAALTLDLTGGSAPFDITWTGAAPVLSSGTAGPNNDWTDLPDIPPFTFNVSPAATTTYTTATVTDASGCAAAIVLSQTVTVRPLVTAVFLAEPDICFGGNTILDIDFSLAGSYVVDYSSCAPLAGGSVTVADLGTIDVPNLAACGNCAYDIDAVSYTTAPACPSSDVANPPLTVTVDCLPTATVTGGITVCNGACTNLTFTCTGVGPWTINYTLGGVAQPVLNSAISPFVLNVCPTATTAYCITSVTDANCTNANNSNLNSCTTVTVLPAYTVVSFTATDYELCPGESSILTVDVGPNTGLFCISIPAASASPFCTQNPTPNFTYTVTPAVTTTYTITSLYPDPNFVACATNPAVSVTINVNSLITALPIDTICNTNVTPYQYQVIYDLGAGETPYDELAGGNGGVFAPADIFTTDWVNTGTANASWTFSDVNDCNSIVQSMNGYTCPTVTDAGSMSNLALSLCGAVAAGGTFNNDQVLDGNDDIMWVLCTNAANPIGTMVVMPGNPNCTAATFTFQAPLAYGTTYYIVAVAGDAGGLPGCVNTATLPPYIDFSNGQPVTWYQTPTATISDPNGLSACQGNSVTLSVLFTGTGPWNFVYSLGGANQPAVPVPANTNPYTFTVNTTTTVALVSVSSGPLNLCTGTVNGGPLNVVINPLPTAVFDGNGSTCAGTPYCFDITLTGSPNWTVVINDPDATDATLTGLTASPDSLCVTAAGSYFITSVTDGNGCTNTADSPTVILTVNSLPIVTWHADSVSYCGGDCVDIELSFVGEQPFTPDFAPGNPAPALSEVGVNAFNAIYNVCVEGNYTVISVTDGNGCVSAVGDLIVVTEIPLPIANAGPDVEQCVDSDVLIGTAAIAGVTYAWAGLPDDDIVGSSTVAQPTVNSPTAGTDTYEVTVTTDIGGCVATDDLDVTYFTLPVIDITANPDSLCAGDCTTLTASGADDYLWLPGNEITASIIACPDTIFSYFVTGTENHPLVSCSAIDSITVFVGEPLDTLIDYTEEVCFGSCNGEIHLTITGGFAPYTITMNGAAASADTTELCPGIYDFTITDAIGCSISGGLEIEERVPELIDEIIVTNPVCDYDLGSIEVTDNTTSINVTSLACNYGLSLPGPNALFDELEACCYAVTTIFEVAPGVFCTTADTVCVEIVSPDISFNAVWTEDTFCFEDDVCFSAVPTGGTGTPDVEWYHDEELTDFWNTDNPYCIQITQDTVAYGVAIDQLGCYSDTVQVSAFLFPAITLEVQNGIDTVYICEYDCAELIAVEGGGNGSVNLIWYELPLDIPISTNDTVVVCPFFETCYYVNADDGCSVPLTDTVCVHVWDTPEVIFATDTMEGCYPLTVEFYDLSIPIADDVTCEWGFGDGNTLGVCDTVQYTYATPALYAEFFPSLTITSEFGCVGTDTLTDPIILHGYPEIDFTWEPQPVTVLEHDSIQMINLTEGAETYFWNFYGNTTSVLENPQHTFPMLDQGIFPVCLTATTEYGCADTLCQDVFVESVLGVFVPNSFTPDEDGINDVFQPIVTGYREGTYHFWVFNRWGDPLFYTEDTNMAWTGGSDGGEFYVNTETYVWRIEVEALYDGKIEVYEGHVTILR